MREKLNRADWIFLSTCGAIFAAGLAIGITFFDDAFPEAAIDFRYDRTTSQTVAQELLGRERLSLTGYRHAAEFDSDESAKIFLERELGLQKTNALTRSEVRIWYWRHRWFRPLQIEEMRVDVAPTGEIVSFLHKIPEDQAAPSLGRDAEQKTAEAFLRQIGIAPQKLQLVSRSEQTLPQRTDITYVWEAQAIRPAGASYRYSVRLQGDRVGAFSQFLKVPDQWSREYQELRSKNVAAQLVDEVFLVLTMIAALAVFIARLRRGDIQLRFSLGAGVIGALLFVVVSLNEFPSALADYDTSTSYPAFLVKQIIFPVLRALFAAILLAVVVGAGEALYRQRLPQHLAMPRVVARNALNSKRVFKGFILGYTLFAAFLAYQVLFYLGASRLGAWAPAETPYSSILNSAFPWAAVLFMGFFPAVSEEFLSRAFSVPFFEQLVRSRVAAMVIAGFIWGFGHAGYPNQPFFIRGVEVGVAGVIMGLLLYRYGLLGLLVWHYTVDALYTALLLFRSNNAYYIFSAGLASLIFVIPTLIAIALYRRNGGFIPDEELNNASIGTVAPAAVAEAAEAPPLATRPMPVTRRAIVIAIVAFAAAAASVLLSGPTLEQIVDYPMPKARAIELARRHLTMMKFRNLPSRVLPLAVSGFRYWDAESRREEGGAPGGYDHAALRYLLRTAKPSVSQVLQIERSKVEAATWMVRFFEPMQKEEILVEVDPRAARVIGMHRYREEEAPGAALEQNAAERLARVELTRYGLHPAQFELKGAFAFQQPHRRDWLFHYEEKNPLAAEAYRRVSVRVMGNEISQFAKTVKIPEQERREAERETVLNIVLVVAKVLAVIALLGMVIYGCVAAARENRFGWRAATRWALLLSPVAVISAFLQRELFLANYQTQMPWQTFTVMLIVIIVFFIAFQLGAVWLSTAILETTFPAARRVIGREGAQRFGPAAVLAAIGVTSLFVLVGSLLRNLPRWLPALTPVDSLSIPELVAIPLPALVVLWEAILTALGASAAVAGFAAALRATPANRRIVLHGIAIVSLMLMATDTSIRLRQLPLMLLIAGGIVALLYLSATRILRDNPLAYPLTFLSIALLSGAAAMLQNDRPDLQLNAAVLIVICLAVLAWYAFASRVIPSEARNESCHPERSEGSSDRPAQIDHRAD